MQQLQFRTSGPGWTFGLRGLRQRADEVGATMVVGSAAANGDGSTAPGALGVFVDELTGYALQASLPPGSWSISTEIWLDVVGDLPGPGGTLRGRARAVQPGSFARGEVRDERGQLVVECRHRGRLAPMPTSFVEATGSAEDHRTGAVGGLREALGVRTHDGVVLLGARRDLLNPNAMLHGGVTLAASDLVATSDRQTRGCDLRTSSIHIAHTRGIPADSAVSFDVEHRHTGRTLWVSHVVGRVEGRTVTVATVTAQA